VEDLCVIILSTTQGSFLLTLISYRYLEDALSLLPNYRPEPPRFKIKQSEEQKSSLRSDLERLDVGPDVKKSLEVLAGSQQIPYDLIAALVTYIVNQRSKDSDEAILIL
jgi:hypothetical protein